MAPPKPKFAEGEKVLCFHGPLIYEAKCLKSSVTKEKHVRYFIHYAGWNKNWDEWVPESRVLKYNDANVQKQKDIQKAHSTQPMKAKKSNEPVTPPALPSRSASKSSSSDTQASSSGELPRKKRTRIEPPAVETEQPLIPKIEAHINLPEELKIWLADDWDIITRQKKLVNLPARVNIDTIINNYISHKKSSKVLTAAKESILVDIISGVKEYFNVALGCQLLYKFERPQYKEILTSHPETPLCQIYGGVHLLRLFVKMGPMLGLASLDEKSMQHVLHHIHDLLKYIVANRASLLSHNDYKNTSPEYHRSVM